MRWGGQDSPCNVCYQASCHCGEPELHRAGETREASVVMSRNYPTQGVRELDISTKFSLGWGCSQGALSLLPVTSELLSGREQSRLWGSQKCRCCQSQVRQCSLQQWGKGGQGGHRGCKAGHAVVTVRTGIWTQVCLIPEPSPLMIWLCRETKPPCDFGHVSSSLWAPGSDGDNAIGRFWLKAMSWDDSMDVSALWLPARPLLAQHYWPFP